MSDTSKIPFTRVVRELPSLVPFVGPDEQERQSGRKFIARLGANESCFGPSPKVLEAISDASKISWQYGDPDNHDLRAALADYYDVGFENVIVGEGIDGLLGYTAHMFVSPGTPVVTSLGSYPTFNFHVKMRGGQLHLVPYRNDHEDPDALLSKVRETGASLLYFSNPNNPMGTWWDSVATQELIDSLPETTVLALDEAYIECAQPGTAPKIDVSQPNVLRFRTFSKLYGLAGARVGYVIGHKDIIASYDKVRNHYGVNLIGQKAALAALSDQDYLAHVKEKVELGRDRIADIAASNGLEPIASSTNFVTLDCKRGSGYAKSVLAGLLEAGIFVRMPGVEPQSRCIRISVGLDHELDFFAEKLGGVLAVADATGDYGPDPRLS